MYKTTSIHQMTFNDFNQSCGMQLKASDEWCVLASRIDWAAAEEEYSGNFKSRKGHPAIPVRQALGALIIQKRMGLSDRALIKAIAENPYYQYFIGLAQFTPECPFTYSTLVGFRRRMGVDFLMRVNERMLASSKPTSEHENEKHPAAAEGENSGTLILDATCSPSNIRYPQDFSLLNEGRMKTDAMIDALYVQSGEAKRPRTYRRVLHAAYLAMAKSKKRTSRAIRALVRKLLCALKRNLDFIDGYLARGFLLTDRQLASLEAIRQMYVQQKEMFNKKTHRVENRVVSLSQPYLRPIVRGKTKTPVEFGAKYDVSIDEKGHARMETVSFDPYNECTVFQDAVGRYFKRTGHYPKRALVDRIYGTKENREFCRTHGIRISLRGPGRPSADRAAKLREHRDQVDRIEVERFFSVEKRCCGAGLIVTRLSCTTLSSIALSVLVANLFGTAGAVFFVLYLMDGEKVPGDAFFCEFLDCDEDQPGFA